MKQRFIFVIGLNICSTQIGIYCEPKTLEGMIAHIYDEYVGAGTPDYEIRIKYSEPNKGGNNEAVTLNSAKAIFTDENYVISSPNHEGMIEPIKKQAELSLVSRYPISDIEYFLRTVLSFRLFEMGGFLFHAAGIVYKGEAYIFFGKSGSGKSTVARLSNGKHILSDDLVGILPGDIGVMAYSTPFWNPGWKIHKPAFADIGGLFSLVQDHNSFTNSIKSSLALSEIMASIPLIPTSPIFCQRLIPIVQKILGRINVYSLHFRQDASFWDVVSKVILK